MPVIYSLLFLGAAVWVALKVAAVEQQKADDAAYARSCYLRVLGHGRTWYDWEGR